MKTQVVKVEIALRPEGDWTVNITKTFSAEHGGGQTTFHYVETDLPAAMKLATAAVTHYSHDDRSHFAADNPRGWTTVTA